MAARRNRAIRALPVLGLVCIICVHWLHSPARLLQWFGEGPRGFAVVGLAVFYVVRPFVLWPLSLASVFVGYLVGFPLGVPFVLLGTVATSFPPFLLADYFQDTNGYVSRISATGESMVQTTGELRGIVAARLSPAPADGVSIGAGLAGVSSRNFVFGTIVGELPWATLYVILGESIQRFSTNPIQSDNMWFLIGVTAGSALLLARPAYDFITQIEW